MRDDSFIPAEQKAQKLPGVGRRRRQRRPVQNKFNEKMNTAITSNNEGENPTKHTMSTPTARRYTWHSPGPRIQTRLSSRPHSPPWLGNPRQSPRWRSLAPERDERESEEAKEMCVSSELTAAKIRASQSGCHDDRLGLPQNN